MLKCVVDGRKRPRLRVPTLASQNRAKGTRRPAASKCAKSAAVPLHNNTHHHHTHTNKIINSFKLQKIARFTQTLELTDSISTLERL